MQDKNNFVYVFTHVTGKILYVGKTNTITRRINEHIRKNKTKDTYKIFIYETSSKSYMDRLEKYLIWFLEPTKNKTRYKKVNLDWIPSESMWREYGGID